MSGAVEQVRHLVAAYRRFIKSSYRLADPRLRAQFEDQVDGREVLVKGPYIALARDFLVERTLDALIDEGVADPRLLFSAGTRLGPYEVVSRVGAGGMGEVWKARDTRARSQISNEGGTQPRWVLDDEIASKPPSPSVFSGPLW